MKIRLVKRSAFYKIEIIAKNGLWNSNSTVYASQTQAEVAYNKIIGQFKAGEIDENGDFTHQIIKQDVITLD